MWGARERVAGFEIELIAYSCDILSPPTHQSLGRGPERKQVGVNEPSSWNSIYHLSASAVNKIRGVIRGQ